MPELQIAPEKVGWLILKARAFDSKVSPVIPADEASDDDEVELVENRADDPDVAEIVGFVRGLNEDEETDLVALTWIGRGSFDLEDWEEARQTAREEKTTRTERYLLGMPLLADYLAEGLEAFGIDPGEAEEDALEE
ncbi:MAG: DUF3775 domain-containing protein [Bauldia sp.]